VTTLARTFEKNLLRDRHFASCLVLHELKRTQEAFDNIASVRDKFRKEHILHYNGGCYLAQLGRLDEARKWLKVAFKLRPEQRTAALSDPDLEMLWTEIRRGIKSKS
jgi:tetratricopeptide (TPR) repeat protein